MTPDPRFHANASAVGNYYWNGLFAESTARLPSWEFRLGGRYDTFSDNVDSLFVPRASVVHDFSDTTSLKFLFAKGALRPSWTQLTGFFSLGGGANYDLEPERSTTYELILQHATERLFTTLSIYHAHYDDTINFVNSTRGAGFANYADYRTTGAELDLRGVLSSWVSGFLALTVYPKATRHENLAILHGTSIFAPEGIQVRPGTDQAYNIPEVFFTTGATFTVPVPMVRRVTLTPLVRFLGSRYLRPLDGLPERREDPSVAVDLKGTVMVSEGISVFVNGRNILDNQDPIGIGRGIPGLVIPKGQTWELGVACSF